MKKPLFQIALEAEQATGKVNKEIEYVFYARLVDTGILEKATNKEELEQWEVRIEKTDENASSGRIRIRKTIENGETTYVMTTKTLGQYVGELKKEIEVSNPSSEDAFKQFKLFAPYGMKKTRYTLPVGQSDLVWEIDIHKLEDDSDSEWVRIELEVEKELETVPQLPDAFQDVIYNQRGSQTEEENKLIEKLYNEVFLAKNEYLTKETND